MSADTMPNSSGPKAFSTTCWSLVRQLDGDGADVDVASRIAELCLRYWAPVQAYIRHRGHAEAEASALTGRFFDYLRREALDRAGRHGRFREFVQVELDGFLVGSGADPSGPRAAADAGGRGTESDEQLRRGFAFEVIAHAMAGLRDEAAEAGRLPMFETLQRYLSTRATAEDVQREAAALGARPLFVAMAIRRLRQRFRRLADEELSKLVVDRDELDRERELLRSTLDDGWE